MHSSFGGCLIHMDNTAMIPSANNCVPRTHWASLFSHRAACYRPSERLMMDYMMLVRGQHLRLGGCRQPTAKTLCKKHDKHMFCGLKLSRSHTQARRLRHISDTA